MKGKKKEAVSYDDIKVLKNETGLAEIGLMIHQAYKNSNIEMKDLIDMVKSLRENPVMEALEHKSNNPVDMFMGFFKK